MYLTIKLIIAQTDRNWGAHGALISFQLCLKNAINSSFPIDIFVKLGSLTTYRAHLIFIGSSHIINLCKRYDKHSINIRRYSFRVV